MSSKQLTILHAAFLIALTSVAYEQVRNHYFVWDTIPFVLENPWIHAWSAENIIAMFTETHRANWHPMVLLSHALDFLLFGDDAGLHHLMNLALHVINVLLLYWLVTAILRQADQSAEFARWTGFLTALIFGLHPQHVESVAWVVERKDVLYTLFALTCLLLYLKLKSRTDVGISAQFWPFLFFCLSVAAKPMAVTLPVVMLLLDVFPLKRFPLNRGISLRAAMGLIVEKLHYIVVAIIVALVTLSTQAIAMPDAINLPLWARTLNAIDNSWFYVAHYTWPLSLSPFYPYPQDASYLANSDFWFAGSFFLLTTTALALWMLYKGQSWPLLLLAFYVLTLLPVSGLIQVGPAKATDHYVYLATIPLSLLTAMALVFCWHQSAVTKVIAASSGALYIVFLLLITQQQVTYWNNPLTLWTRVIQLHPESPFGHRNLAAAYIQIGEEKLALQHAELSLELGSPDLDYVLQLREKIKSAEARLD